MKYLLPILVASALVINSLAFPLEEELSEDGDVAAEHIRVKRVTCDLLSAEAKGVKLNHSACAAHCLLRLKRGGYCNKKRVCVCRN